MSLFKSMDEVRKFISIDENMQFDSFDPFVNQAEKKYIKPLLGELYPVLLNDYTDHTNADGSNGTGVDPSPAPMDPDNLELLPEVQRALAYYAAYQCTLQIGVSVGQAGLQEQFGSNSRPAPRWKTRELQLEYITQADQWSDSLLDFLEENASPTKYNDWYSDVEANTAMQGIIVYKTAIASKYIDINESRRVFLRLKKRIIDIESTEIRKSLCEDQYQELVTQIKSGSLSTDNKRLLTLIEPYVSKKALWLTIPSIRISITDEGVTVHSSNDSVVQKTYAQQADVDRLLVSLKEGEYGFDSDWTAIDQFIVDNISKYPLIAASPCWTSKNTAVPRYQVKNDPCNKHFSV
jgi:hypothetical protein